MIGYLRGEILEHSDDGKMVVLAGGVSTGVGYQVLVPSGPEYGAYHPGRTIELFVHTHVREDALDLFGFASRMEKELFLTLLNVNGIGPKGALGILSKVETDHLIEAVLEGDKDTLTKIPGIGKKTAERVVLELADPLRKKIESGALAYRRTAAGGRRAAPTGDLFHEAEKTKKRSENAIVADAKAALINLGYREQDVSTLLKRVIEEAAEPPRKAEDLIKTALRQLS